MTTTRRSLLATAVLAAAAAAMPPAPRAGAAAVSDRDARLAARIAPYAYTDTRRLVAIVEDAATLMEERGESAFADFAVHGSRWFDRSTYLFVYDLDGTCVFHALTPALVGRNLIDLRDPQGRPVIRWITEIGRRPEPDAAGWHFYFWQDGPQISPSWKSAYLRKVIIPGGRILVVGSGLYNVKMERAFIEEHVAEAVALLLSDGKEAAFRAFADPATPFNFLGAYIFVLDREGHTLFDPAFPNRPGRDLSTFSDAVNMRPVRELLGKLEASDEAWVQFLWPRPGEAEPSRKLVYARKIELGKETLIVGSEYFLATPIWMRT